MAPSRTLTVLSNSKVRRAAAANPRFAIFSAQGRVALVSARVAFEQNLMPV
jgi:hypothetical protein